MTDKECLEMIKGIQKRIKECQEKSQNVSNLHSDYVDWLIGQAEKAEQLELEINDWRAEVQKWQKFYKESEESHLETKKLLHSTINENQRYKQALEFYAGEEHYKDKQISEVLCDADGVYISKDEYLPSIIYLDKGETARKALKSDEN